MRFEGEGEVAEAEAEGGRDGGVGGRRQGSSSAARAAGGSGRSRLNCGERAEKRRRRGERGEREGMRDERRHGQRGRVSQWETRQEAARERMRMRTGLELAPPKKKGLGYVHESAGERRQGGEGWRRPKRGERGGAERSDHTGRLNKKH